MRTYHLWFDAFVLLDRTSIYSLIGYPAQRTHTHTSTKNSIFLKIILFCFGVCVCVCVCVYVVCLRARVRVRSCVLIHRRTEPRCYINDDIECNGMPLAIQQQSAPNI